jgi:hypothetical protein
MGNVKRGKQTPATVHLGIIPVDFGDNQKHGPKKNRDGKSGN